MNSCCQCWGWNVCSCIHTLHFHLFSVNLLPFLQLCLFHLNLPAGGKWISLSQCEELGICPPIHPPTPDMVLISQNFMGPSQRIGSSRVKVSQSSFHSEFTKSQESWGAAELFSELFLSQSYSASYCWEGQSTSAACMHVNAPVKLLSSADDDNFIHLKRHLEHGGWNGFLYKKISFQGYSVYALEWESVSSPPQPVIFTITKKRLSHPTLPNILIGGIRQWLVSPEPHMKGDPPGLSSLSLH